MNHGRDCTPLCAQLAVPSPLDRDRPPMTSCPYCGAQPGLACFIRLPGLRRRKPLHAFGRSHPSRLEEAA